MKNNLTSKFLVLFLTIGIGLSSTNTINAQQNLNYGILTFNKAVNISGKQRMLSQKMAKSYLYLVANPSDNKAKRDLLTSKIIFEKQNGIIGQNAGYKLTKDKLAKVDKIWIDFKKVLESSPNYDNAKKIIDLNTDLLRATNEVVSAVIMESKGAVRDDSNVFEEETLGESDLEHKRIIDMAGRQRMLSQRLALYYYANQTTLKTKSSQSMLNNVFNEIDGAITMLLISNFNNDQIEEKLGVAMTKWELVKNNKKKLMNQGFKPSEIYKISNELTKAFNTVTALYEKAKI